VRGWRTVGSSRRVWIGEEAAMKPGRVWIGGLILSLLAALAAYQVTAEFARPSAAAAPEVEGRLGIPSWTLSFTILRNEDSELSIPQFYNSTVFRSSASGGFTLSLGLRSPEAASWEGEGQVRKDALEQRLNLYQNPDGGWHLIERARTEGSDVVDGSALLGIDAVHGTYGLTISIGGIDVVVEIQDMLGVRTETRTNVFGGGAGVRDQPVPPDGPLAGSDVQIVDTGMGTVVTTVMWRLVPTPGESADFSFDPCPTGDPVPPELAIMAAAAGPYPQPDLTTGLVGVPRARALADELVPDLVFCGIPVLPGAVQTGNEVTSELNEEARRYPPPWEPWEQREIADRSFTRVERLIGEIEARDPSLEQVRTLLFAEGILQMLYPDGSGHAGDGLEAAQRAFERYAQHSAEDADISRLIEMAAQAQLLELYDLGVELLERADYLAFLDLEGATQAFDACRATAEDLAGLIDTWARWVLLGEGDEEARATHRATGHVERVLARLRGTPDPACPGDDAQQGPPRVA
jgi:hypothetical protein